MSAAKLFASGVENKSACKMRHVENSYLSAAKHNSVTKYLKFGRIPSKLLIPHVQWMRVQAVASFHAWRFSTNCTVANFRTYLEKWTKQLVFCAVALCSDIGHQSALVRAYAAGQQERSSREHFIRKPRRGGGG